MGQYWRGHLCEEMQFEGRYAIIVFPEKANGFLAIKTEYWDAFPEAIEDDLVKVGFHLCYIKNDNRWGTDDDLDRKARFLCHIQNKYSLHKACIPIGMSCGGLIAIKFAAKYPELVKCLYLDAPVLNYMSCPCGFGIGKPLSKDNSEILNALGFASISELICCRDMPMDKIPALVQNRIPVVMVVGDSDQIVPYCENGEILVEAYRKAGVDVEVHIKPGCDHHPHGLENPKAVLDYLLKVCVTA